MSRSGLLASRPVATLDISELVIEARHGDRQAMSELFRRYARTVERLICRLQMNQADTHDDLMQEAFVTAIDSLGALRNPERFGGWLRRIVINTVRRHGRQRGILKRLGIISKVSSPDPDELVSSQLPPDINADLQRLYRRLDELPFNLRAVIILRHVDGEPLANVAEAMNVSLATAKRWLTRGEHAISSPTQAGKTRH